MNPYWDIKAKGAFIGLSSSHNRGHLYRSILEGIAFEQLFAINSVEKNIGVNINNFVAIGGGATNALWRKIVADVTGKEICIPQNTEASALGAGIAASVGAGWYRSFKEAANEMVDIKKTIYPDMHIHKRYKQLFAFYKKIYLGLQKMGNIY
jgi:xylulokinase